MGKNKSNLNGFLTCFSMLLIFYLVYTAAVYVKLYVSLKNVEYIERTEYLRIKIYGSSQTADGNTISATFSVIDSNSNEIAVIERSWSGSYLAVEFASFEMNGKQFIFPSKIYGKNHIFENRLDSKKVTSLEKYYNENKQCMLYGYGTTYRQRHMLYNIAAFATDSIGLPVINFGVKNKYIMDLSNCKNDTYYSITADEAGRLILIEL